MATQPDMSSTNDVEAGAKDGSVVHTLDPQGITVQQKTKEERWFLFKLDCFLLAFGCVSQVIKYIDQTNINFAFVSGLQEDLQLNGNELNYFITYFNVGYAIFLIPSQIFITRFRPSIWLSCLELVWGILTGCIAACNSAKPIYAVRALIGIAESSAYPGTVTLLMTWYTPLEMAKRIGFYHSCQGIGAMIAGALQTAIWNTMEGTGGLPGWRWTFIINCIMTIAVGICGFFMIPDFPDSPNPRARFWFKEKDYEIAQRRLARFSRNSPDPINWKCAVRTLKNPILYMLIYIYVGLLIAISGSGFFNLWLRSLRNPDGTPVWTVSALNAIPIGGYAIQVVAVWIFAWGSDILKTRWSLLLTMSVLGLPSGIIMTIWNVPTGAKYFSYFSLFFVTAGGPPLWSWMSDMLPRDAEQRALIIGICIALYYATFSWSNIVMWPTKSAPLYRGGWAVTVFLWITIGMVVIALRIYDVKVVRPRNFKIAQDIAEHAPAETVEQVVLQGEVIQVQPDEKLEARSESDNVYELRPKPVDPTI